MANVDLGIGIGAEYKGRAAFKKAEKDILGLSAGVKTLAKAYIGLAGAQKAFRYATASIKAFAQDDAAVKTLSKTLDNLGLAYEQTNVENFIAGLESTFHVADDLLRPAFSKLVQVTQSYTKSKELLTVALNASAGAGVDLSTTISDLSAAYVGNLKGLKKYNLGLTNAELATKSFAEIQALLNKTFAGQASLAADTYAKKLDALTIASGNAKEIIGQGLVDAISTAFGNGDIEKATKNIEAMAGGIAEIVRGLGDVARLSGFSLLSNVFGALADKRNALATKDRKFDPRTGNMPDLTPAGLKLIMARKKADADAAKRQKELAALAQKQVKALKDQTALAKAKAVLDKSNMIFNMDLIQNTAALQGKVTEDETLRLRVQREILLGNSKAAADLAQELLSVQLAAVIAGNVNPFGQLSDSVMEAINSIKQLRTELELLGSPKVKTPAQLLAEDYQSALISIADPSFDLQTQAVNDFLNSLNNPNPFNMPASATNDSFKGFGRGGNMTPGTTFPEIKITIDPTAAQYGIGVASVNNSANGNNNNYTTIQSFAGGL